MGQVPLVPLSISGSSSTYKSDGRPIQKLILRVVKADFQGCKLRMAIILCAGNRQMHHDTWPKRVNQKMWKIAEK